MYQRYVLFSFIFTVGIIGGLSKEDEAEGENGHGEGIPPGAASFGRSPKTHKRIGMEHLMKKHPPPDDREDTRGAASQSFRSPLGRTWEEQEEMGYGRSAKGRRRKEFGRTRHSSRNHLHKRSVTKYASGTGGKGSTGGSKPSAGSHSGGKPNTGANGGRGGDPEPEPTKKPRRSKGSLDIKRAIIIAASILLGIPAFVIFCVAIRACGFKLFCDCCFKETNRLRIGYGNYKPKKRLPRDPDDQPISTISGNPEMVQLKEFGSYIKTSMSNIKNSLFGLGGGTESKLPDVENPSINSNVFNANPEVTQSRHTLRNLETEATPTEVVEETLVRQPTVDNDSLSGESSEVTVENARESESARTTPDDQDPDVQQMRPMTGQQAPDLPPRPKTGEAGSRPATAHSLPRPMTAHSLPRPATAHSRPGTAHSRPGTAHSRPGTAAGRTSPGALFMANSDTIQM